MDDLNTHINDQLVNKPSVGLRSLITGPKIIFVILGIILLGELIYAIKVLTQPALVSPPPSAQSGVQITPGKIFLIANKTNVNIKDALPVSVAIDTGGHKVNGVDLIVHYDPKVLEATVGGITKGIIFDEYPSVTIDPVQGLIAISGIDNTNNSYNSKDINIMGGSFVTLNLRAKASGKTQLTVDFKGKGSTTDSNLVEMGTAKDILEQVGNLELTVK